MDKYLMTYKWLVRLVPDLKTGDLNRNMYQLLLNQYAEFHERQTVMDFHHQLKGAILDAVDIMPPGIETRQIGSIRIEWRV